MAAKKEKSRRARGDGGLTQLESGLWVGSVELPRDLLTGNRRQKRVSSMDHDIAMKKLNKAKLDLGNNGDLPTGSETVATWMEYWLENICKVRPSTKAGYRSSVKYIIASIGKIRITALVPADVRKIESYIVKTKKLSPTTALQSYQIFAKAMKDAEREGRVTRNVARLVDPPRKAVPKIKVLTTDEGIQVIRTVVEDRLGSRAATALLTGARQGEVLGLELDRVDFDADLIDLSWQLQRVNWLHGCEGTCGRKRGTDCPQKTIDAPHDWEHRHIEGGLYWSRPKSKAGWRVIPMVEPLRSILARRVAAALTEPNPHGLVWTADPKKSKGGASTKRRVLPLDGSPIDPAKDNAAWHRVLERAGVTDVRLHDARHTAVTILYDLGVPEAIIQDIVGQSTISVTRAYRHKSPAQLKAAMEALGQALSEKLALPAAAELTPLQLEAA